jgi:hypothetical protein
MRTSAQCAIGSNLVSDAPRTVIWPVARGERQKSTQLRRSGADQLVPKPVVAGANRPAAERPSRPSAAVRGFPESCRSSRSALNRERLASRPGRSLSRSKEKNSNNPPPIISGAQARWSAKSRCTLHLTDWRLLDARELRLSKAESPPWALGAQPRFRQTCPSSSRNCRRISFACTT